MASIVGLRVNDRFGCDRRAIRLGVYRGISSEKAVSVNRSRRARTTLGCRHNSELGRNERDRFTRGGIICSVDLAVGRELSIQKPARLFDVRRHPGNSVDPCDDFAVAHETPRNQGRRRKSPGRDRCSPRSLPSGLAGDRVVKALVNVFEGPPRKHRPPVQKKSPSSTRRSRTSGPVTRFE